MYIESTNALLKMLESPSNLPPSSATALLQLKRLSRSSLAALKEKEDKLLKAKKKVESEGLKLQNLLYEKQHLLREIQLAKELQTKNLDKLATAESTTATELIPNLSEPKTSAEHTKNLDFLAAKLESRKRLTEQLTTAHSTKKQKIAENVSKKEFLSSLPHHLENLAKAAKPLQQYLSVSANNIDRSIYDDARTKLTKELYVLFANLSNANER
jgi:THO complex subunit 5